MKQELPQTDDVSFGLYLSKIDHNTLHQLTINQIKAEDIIDEILKHEYLQIDCLNIICGDDMPLPPKIREEMLKEELLLSDDPTIHLYMDILFSKKIIIDMLVEHTNETGREKIIALHSRLINFDKGNINYN
jgi:hypothetical protein